MTGRILIVDDRVANLGVLESKLASEYFDVSTATSGLKSRMSSSWKLLISVT